MGRVKAGAGASGPSCRSRALEMVVDPHSQPSPMWDLSLWGFAFYLLFLHYRVFELGEFILVLI